LSYAFSPLVLNSPSWCATLGDKQTLCVALVGFSEIMKCVYDMGGPGMARHAHFCAGEMLNQLVEDGEMFGCPQAKLEWQEGNPDANHPITAEGNTVSVPNIVV
jgi:hypothetical protein